MPFNDHMQRNRFELKYLIDERCARGVRDFIRSHLVHDRFARTELGWAYPIYSIYVDGPSLDCFNATLCGHKNRFKLRARYYDDKPDSPVFSRPSGASMTSFSRSARRFGERASNRFLAARCPA